MRLARFSVENYRAFVDPANLELRPLTLFFGYNSAGKSALVRFLPIIGASSSPEQTTPLALDSPAARGASFREILSRQSSSPTLRLALQWIADQDALSVEVDVRDLPERQLQVAERFKVSEPDSEVECIWNASSGSLSSRSREYDVTQNGITVGTFPMTFQGIVPVTNETTRQPLLEHASAALRGLRDRVHWLNSLRAVPPRVSRFGTPPSRMSHDGANAGDYLAHDAIADGTLVQSVSAVFEKTTGHRLEIKRYALAGEEQYAIAITQVGASPVVEVPIVDTGEGMAQLLPVVVLGCLAQLGRLPENSIMAVEHPELHLHPAAHAALAEFFCTLVAKSQGPMAVIETHSENFLLRVQIAIARGEVSPDDVIVHWIRPLPSGSVVDTITFDAAARPLGAGWPPGVFSEDLMQARELLNLRKQKGLA